MIRDLTDDEARAASPLKWGMTEPGVIPAWVAEMDYAVAEPIVAALQDAIGRGELGYPRFDLGGGPLARRTPRSPAGTSGTTSTRGTCWRPSTSRPGSGWRWTS